MDTKRAHHLHPHRLRLHLLATVAILTGSSACGDDADADLDGSAPTDSGTTDAPADTPDAWVPVCDEVPSPPPPCSEVAGADEVTVSTVAAVAFHDACGEVVCVNAPDPAGTSSGPASDGGMVSIRGPAGVFTYGGLAIGDQLVPAYPLIAGSADHAITVDFPLVDGATSYSFSGGGVCPALQVRSSPATVMVGALCAGSDEAFALRGVARAGVTVIADAWIRDVELAASGDTEVTLPEWTPDPVVHSISITGLSDSVVATSLVVRSIVDRVEYACDFDCLDTATPAGGEATLTVTMPADAGDAVRYLVTNASGPLSRESLLRVAAELPETIDVLTGMLPTVAFQSQSEDLERPQIAWTISPDQDADALVIVTQWGDGAEVDSWRVVLPPDTASPFRLPALPADFVPDLPLMPSPRTIEYFEVGAIDGYAEAKPAIFPVSLPDFHLWPYLPGHEHRIAIWGEQDLLEL